MTFTKRLQFFMLSTPHEFDVGWGSSETTQPALPVGTDDQGVVDVPTTGYKPRPRLMRTSALSQIRSRG